MLSEPLTVPELLASAAERARGGFFFHLAGGPVALAEAELYARALGRAAQLQGSGFGQGAMVGLLGPNCPEWAEWAWGTWLSGAVLVPLPAPLRVRDRSAYSGQVASLAGATNCSVIVGADRYLSALDGALCQKLAWGDEPRSGVPLHPVQTSPADLAMVLCTSGSTAAPKAVRMTHERAVVWARARASQGPICPVPVSVSWLPFYHIGGLGALFEVFSPVERHFLPMAQFARDPAQWLRLASRTGASFTVGPSSAWAAAVRGLAKSPAGANLSCLRNAFFNAEMVAPDVVERISEVCAPLGLAPGSLGVHYASSEAGLICHADPGRPLRIDEVDLDELARSWQALPARAGKPVKRVVSCGVPFAGVEVCAGRPSAPLADRHVGEIWVRGPGVTDGYLNLSSEGQFAGDWLRTGDLGYQADGEWFVTGRLDEVIVRLGEKFHPEDIEQAVQRATGVPASHCVAFSAEEGGQGGLVVVVEAFGGSGELARRARAAVANALGLAPSEVLVVRRGTIPTTANGKLQRAAARQLHQRAKLRPLPDAAAPANEMRRRPLR